MRNKLLVAPLAGAWIEMRCNIARFCACIVAPLAGAWLEISAFRGSRLSIASLHSRERGLKLDNKFKVGAAKESLPSRERGLKSHDRENRKRDLQSLPSRERGLKYEERI